jgi:hypothetical protein
MQIRPEIKQMKISVITAKYESSSMTDNRLR